jgi:hypothetical protein
MGSTPRLVAIVVILAVTVMVVTKIFFGGPDPEKGKCVNARGALVGCGQRAALYKLVREVDDGRECPSDASKLYRFRSSLFCGVALKGAPPPSAQIVPCLLQAGAKLAGGPGELAFARGVRAADAASARPGVIKVRGDDWRMFYVLHAGQLDPGPAAVVARPGQVVYVAYIERASEHRKAVAAATRCARASAP